ncbi:hypothetical protein DFH08DRAFT_825934 [Mycena albidolilacea]|uniref:Uncharacterized protein n=1 Tax=Mycena albidolilacea TaxID=1033008 RepID=A0AAD6Z137_9AGAR|nr:hypothetical protein DFH08DRAFT_825934 [Mycena albidolilacea]
MDTGCHKLFVKSLMYFISGLPSQLKEVFVLRVPEAQQLFDKNSLYSGVWTSAPPDPIRAVPQPFIPVSISASPKLIQSLYSVYFDPVPLNPPQTCHIGDDTEHAHSLGALSMPVVIEGARPIHAAEQKMVLNCIEETQPESKLLEDPSTIDTVHDLEAAIRDLNQLIELMNIMDPEELSQSSSLISHIQGLPNSFNFPEDIGDVHHEDQVPVPQKMVNLS